MKIDTEEPAKRLASALVRDILLYNSDKDADTLANAVAEARALFLTRAPAFGALFENELQVRLPAAAPAPSAPPREQPRSTRSGVVLVSSILVVAVGVYFLLTNRAPQPSVSVTYAGTTTTVPIRTSMTLAEAVKPLLGAKPLSAVQADFKASDGFRPGSKPKCEKLVPLPGELLSRGHIDGKTRNLSWDVELDYPGCMRMRDCAQITLSDRP